MRHNGSLDKYSMCNRTRKRGGLGGSRLVLAAAFLCACVYFALTVVAGAQTYEQDLKEFPANSP